MVREENQKIKEIDKIILNELKNKLEIRLDNFDILNKDEGKKIINLIEEKKKVIFLLFEGDFSLNEQNIKERLPNESEKTSFYGKIVNNIILRRIEKIFNRMTSIEEENSRLISVCADRQFFIEKIISEDVDRSFIERCINDMER